MKEGRPSATAEAMAAARAFGSFVYRREKILDEPLAEHFLGGRHSHDVLRARYAGHSLRRIKIYPFLRIARAEVVGGSARRP